MVGFIRVNTADHGEVAYLNVHNIVSVFPRENGITTIYTMNDDYYAVKQDVTTVEDLIGETLQDEIRETVFKTFKQPENVDKWIRDGHHLRCPRCGEYLCERDAEGDRYPTNYCPNCGRRLELEDC